MRARYPTDTPGTTEGQGRMNASGESPFPDRRESVPYEPPRVERVLSPEDLQREVLYAGGTATGTDG